MNNQAWAQRNLSDTRSAYLWSDAIYRNVQQHDCLCLLVVIGVTAHGDKELLTVEEVPGSPRPAGTNF